MDVAFGMFARRKISPVTRRKVINAFLEQRAELEKKLPAEKGNHHQYRLHFDPGAVGSGIAIYGGWPWKLFWLHYNREQHGGVHQIEAYEVEQQAG